MPEPSPLPGVLRLESALRRRLAADLHDDPLQALAAVAMALELARMQRDDVDELKEIEDAAREAVRRLRRMLAEITGPEETPPLADALKNHLGALGERCAIRVESEPPPELRRFVSLMAAEAAAAGAAGVRIGRADGEVVVHIDGADRIDLELVMARAAIAGGACRDRENDALEIRLPVG